MENKNGFGTSEFFIVSLVCLVLSLLLLLYTFASQEGEQYTVFAYNAKTLGTNAVHYQMTNKKNTVYLKKLVEMGLLTEIKNPFPGEEYCDMYESKVVFEGDEKKVTLRCGNYLIQNQTLGEHTIPIYHVSDWKETKQDHSEMQTIYNYKDLKNPSLLLDTFLEESLFLQELNEKNQTNYQQIKEIPKEYQVKKKTVYRTKKLVKTIHY